MSRISSYSIALFLASSCLTAAHAQTADIAEEPVGDDIIVTGTREAGVAAADSPTPIQVLGEEALTRVGQPNLNQALTQIVPSFTAQSQGTDMASFALSARLRGVSPNHTLVMVNNKRRHGNSILQVINGAFGGSAAPSLDLIPPDAVQRIEILQDGAAAQYGSDAIAGVINIILKNDPDGGSIRLNAGEYYDGEGRTYSASGNFGVQVGEAGFLNLTLFHRRNDYTTVGEGQTAVRNINGSTVTLSAANRLFQPIYNALNDANGTAAINGGQPKSQLNILFYNAGYDFGGVELYSFGDVSYRHGKALQGYRAPNRVCVPGTAANPTDPARCFQPTVAAGMVPLIEVKQDEFSLTNGLRGDASGWNWDLGFTYAEDHADVYTTNSANASLFLATGKTPRDFYDGGFKFTQLTSTLDVNKEFDIGWADPLTFAFGLEYRREKYRIYAGDELSRFFEGGQSFPGYGLGDAVGSKRNAKAIYGNIIAKPVTDWTIDLAGRFEDYSDFGSTQIGKITTRYDFNEAFALRATASTGFRAPTLQESGYSATNVGPTSATVQLAPNSAAAAASGFGNLRPEKSVNLSAGTVLRPAPKLIVTLDAYYIKIKNRIVSSGSITGQRQNPIAGQPAVPVTTPLINGLTPYKLVTDAIAVSGKQIDPTVLATGSLGIQTYTNGIDTRTMGLEFSARYPIDLDFGRLDLTLGANYNKTKVTKNRLGTLFSAQAEAIIETSSPDFKSVLGMLFTTGRFSANARATYYGKATVLVSPAITTLSPLPGNFYQGVVKATPIFDLELGYDITDWANLAVGANNLFDKIPNVPALLTAADLPAGVAIPTNGTSPYINGTTTIGAPYNHGPYGTNGGYYYARLSFKF
jgi:iron complex outermembrane recepter protein